MKYVDFYGYDILLLRVVSVQRRIILIWETGVSTQLGEKTSGRCSGEPAQAHYDILTSAQCATHMKTNPTFNYASFNAAEELCEVYQTCNLHTLQHKDDFITISNNDCNLHTEQGRSWNIAQNHCLSNTLPPTVSISKLILRVLPFEDKK